MAQFNISNIIILKKLYHGMQSEIQAHKMAPYLFKQQKINLSLT